MSFIERVSFIENVLYLEDPLNCITYLIRDSQVLDGATSDETFWHFPKPVPILKQRERLDVIPHV